MEGDALLVLTLNPICKKMFFGFADVIFFLKKKEIESQTRISFMDV